MFSPKGKFTWYELMTSDTKAAGRFYSEVVGWKTHEMPAVEGIPQYTTFNLGDVGMAGMPAIPGHSAWAGFVSVEDVDAHVGKILEAGGRQLQPPREIPGMLRFAVVSDPHEAVFVVFTPNPSMPSPQRPERPAPGTIGWHELHTSDPDAAYDFYNRLFGWTTVRKVDMGPMGTYRVFTQGDHPEMGDGGIMMRAPRVPVSHWAFYFSVDSIGKAVERVKAQGGRVLNGPIEVPGGAWIVNAQDPQGVMFSLISNQA